MYFGNQPSVRCGVKIFFYSVGYCFVLFIMSFPLQKLLSFRRFYLLIVALSVCADDVIFMKWSPVPMHPRLLPTLSSIRVSVIGFMLRSSPNVDLSFVNVQDRDGSIFILLHVNIQL